MHYTKHYTKMFSEPVTSYTRSYSINSIDAGLNKIIGTVFPKGTRLIFHVQTATENQRYALTFDGELTQSLCDILRDGVVKSSRHGALNSIGIETPNIEIPVTDEDKTTMIGKATKITEKPMRHADELPINELESILKKFSATDDPDDPKTWALQGDQWLFGRITRGIIPDPEASVRKINRTDNQEEWAWRITATVSTTNSGSEPSFTKAVAKATSALFDFHVALYEYITIRNANINQATEKPTD